MKREEFVFTIGYQGDTAIVDGQALKKYKKISTTELLEKGLYKSAFCAALYSGDENELEAVLKAYNEKSDIQYDSVLALKRLFGVFDIPEDITKVNYI